MLDDDESSPSSFDLMHDSWLSCDGAPLALIAADVFERCEKQRVSTGRKPRRDAVERRRHIIDNIVANLALLVLNHPSGCRIAVSTRNDAITRYDRRDFPKELFSKTLLLLESHGFINRHNGVRQKLRTSFEPSPELRLRISTKVFSGDIGRTAGGETVILRASGQRRGENKALIDYADTAETVRLRAEMSTINVALNMANITVDGIRCGPIHLTRRFQIGSASAPHTFDQHGRIYDGFWINMHRMERHRIRINGEALADLDLTALFTQLAYLEAGLPLPDGDPYSGLPGLDLTTADPNHAAAQRDAIKRGLNAFFFRTGRMERLPSEVKHLLGREWTATKFAAAVRTRHAPVKHLFGTGIGIHFMFTESRILVKTLLDLIDLGIPALPIHDGIMVPLSSQARVLDVMRKASLAIVGVELPVKAKRLLHPDTTTAQ
jgi:hypothetical protein